MSFRCKSYVATGTMSASLRPDVFEAWEHLLKTIRSKMRLRRYELVTIAAALALHCTYCLLAHGAMLRRQLFSAEQLEAIVRDYHAAGSGAPGSCHHGVRREGHSACPRHPRRRYRSTCAVFGLSDEEILDIILAASAAQLLEQGDRRIGTEAGPAVPGPGAQRPQGDAKRAPLRRRPRSARMCFGTHIVKKIRTEDGREEYFCPDCSMGGVLKTQEQVFRSAEATDPGTLRTLQPRGHQEDLRRDPRDPGPMEEVPHQAPSPQN